MSDRVVRSHTRVKGFDDAEMDFQLIRQLGSCAYGGASVGQCLALAERIENGSSSAWVTEFGKLGEMLEKDAMERAGKGHGVSARDQFLMACNAYRAAEYYTRFDDEKHVQMGLRSRECFIKAMKHSEVLFEFHQVEFEGVSMPVYFLAPDTESWCRKTLMVVSGFDGTLEEHYICNGKAALERGYNVVLFAGPGQMDTLRMNPGTVFRHDFEGALAAVIDSLSARKDIDFAKLALLGVSFGGYFAVRATSHESRIKALAANSPIVDLHAYMSAMVGFDPAEMPDEENFRPEDLAGIPDEVMNEQMKAMSANLMGRFGQPSFRDTFLHMRKFKVGEALKNIECPCLAMAGSGEGGETARQMEEFNKNVGGSVKSHLFSELEGADSHCQVGNSVFSNAVLMDWLDEVFS